MIRVDGQCAGAWIACPSCKGVMLDPSIRLVNFELGNAQLCGNRAGGRQNMLGCGPGDCC
jgi:hypothetical protein